MAEECSEGLAPHRTCEGWESERDHPIEHSIDIWFIKAKEPIGNCSCEHGI